MPAFQESLDLLEVAGTDAAQAAGWGAHVQRSQQAPPTAQADAGPGPAELWSQAVRHLQEEHEEVSLATASAKGCWDWERPLDSGAAELAPALLAARLPA